MTVTVRRVASHSLSPRHEARRQRRFRKRVHARDLVRESGTLRPYGWGLSFGAFGASENDIAEYGIDQYYVADFRVEEQTEQMINIRTLEAFLLDKDPDQLERLRALVEIEGE